MNPKTLKMAYPAFLGQIVQGLLTISYVVILARLLSPEDFGLFGLTWIWLGVLYLISDLGLSDQSIQSQSAVCNFKIYQKLSHWLAIGVGIIAIALGFGVSLIYQEPQIAKLGLILSPAFIFHALAHPYRSVLREQKKFLSLNLIQTLALLLAVIVATYLGIRGYGVYALVGLFITREGITAFGLICATKVEKNSKETEQGAVGILKQIIKPAGNLSVLRLVYSFTSRLDQILLGFFAPIATIGVYNRILTLVEMPVRNLFTPLGQFGLPLLSQADKTNKDQVLGSLFKIALLFWIPFVSLCIAQPQWLINLALGEQWLGGADWLPFLSLAFSAKLLTDLINLKFISNGDYAYLRNWSLGSFTFILLILAYSVNGGPDSLAKFLCIGYVVLLIQSFFRLKRKEVISVSSLTKGILPYLIVMITTVAALSLLNQYTLSEMMLLSSITLVTTTSLILLFLILKKGFRSDD